jgi:hypothetical protein
MFTNLKDLKGALAFFLVCVAAFMVILWMLHPPQGDGNALALLAGFVTLFIKMAADAIGYQFNSSAGSEKKDAVQAEVAGKLADKVASPVTSAPTTDQLGASMLSNGELDYFKALPDDEAKKRFLAMSQAERTAEIGKS